MKKIKLVLFTIISLFIFNVSVNADATIKCSASNVTCTFENKSNSLNGSCSDSSNNNYTLQNLNGTLDSKMFLNTATNNYSYELGNSNFQCPDYMLISKNSKDIVFLEKDNGQYKVPCAFKSSSCQDDNEMVSATLQELSAYLGYAMSTLTNKDVTFTTSTSTTVSSKVDSDCATQLSGLKNKLDSAYDAVRANSCQTDHTQGNCPTLYSNWQSEISNAKTVGQQLVDDGTCSAQEISDFNKQLTQSINDYNVTSDYDNPVDVVEFDYDTKYLKICDVNESPKVVATFKLIGIFITIVKIIVPLILIVMGMIDISKSVIDGKTDSLQKDLINFLKRAVAGILIFFVPTLFLSIFHLVDGWDNVQSEYQTCVDCLLGSDECPNVSFMD